MTFEKKGGSDLDLNFKMTGHPLLNSKWKRKEEEDPHKKMPITGGGEAYIFNLEKLPRGKAGEKIIAEGNIPLSSIIIIERDDQTDGIRTPYNLFISVNGIKKKIPGTIDDHQNDRYIIRDLFPELGR